MSRPYPHTLREEVKEILREEIRYRAKDVIFPVLRAKDVGLKVGVGTPFIIKDLDTDQSYMLFTGWDDVEGRQRRVFIIPIDKDLNVNTSKVKEIVRPIDFGVTGVNCVHAFWDDLNEEWVLFHTFYGVSANSTGGVAFFDKEFNLKNTQMLTFTRANGTSTNLGDAGISSIPLANKNLLLTAEIGYDRSCWLISNYTERPLPTPTQINTYNTTLIRIVPSCFSTGLAVYQTILLNSGIVMLSELCHNRTTWFLQVFYGPERDLIVHDTIIPVTFVSPVTPLLLFHFTDVVGNIEHPHYTLSLIHI